MKSGDEVVYLADPLLCFRPFELEMFSAYVEARDLDFAV